MSRAAAWRKRRRSIYIRNRASVLRPWRRRARRNGPCARVARKGRAVLNGSARGARLFGGGEPILRGERIEGLLASRPPNEPRFGAA